MIEHAWFAWVVQPRAWRTDGPHYCPEASYNSIDQCGPHQQSNNRDAPKWSAESRGAFIGSPFAVVADDDVIGGVGLVSNQGSADTLAWAWTARVALLDLEVRSSVESNGGRRLCLCVGMDDWVVAVGSTSIWDGWTQSIDRWRGHTLPRPLGDRRPNGRVVGAARRRRPSMTTTYAGYARSDGRMAVFLFIHLIVYTILHYWFDRPTDPTCGTHTHHASNRRASGSSSRRQRL